MGDFECFALYLSGNTKSIKSYQMDFDLKILQRFFRGECTRKEFLNVKSFLTDSARRDKLMELMQNHWFDYKNESLPEENVDYILHKIHHQIRLENNPLSKTRFLTAFQRIAAILIIPIIITFGTIFYFQVKTTTPEIATAEIQCPLGVRTKFILPDGTKGFLNNGSSLKYPVNFNRERTVTLNGEAYFDVMRDEEVPFIVNTSNLSTKVLGTQFNVVAYSDENTEEIILKEGRVEVYSDQGDKLETLQPNQNLVLNTQTKKYSTKLVDASQYISWTEGKLVFRNENMLQLANRLGRWYNVEVEIKDQELLNYAFRATFIDEQLEEVLKILALTAPISVEEKIRETTNNDTYETRKIIISLDRSRLDAF